MRKTLALAVIQTVVVLTLASAQADDVHAGMANVLRYAGVTSPDAADVGRMADLWTRAQQPGLPREERRLVFRDMYLLYGKLRGRDLSASPQALDGLSQFVVSTFEGGGRMDLALPEPRGTPTGKYLHVETRGNGPIPLLLISDLGTDGRALYGSFLERQRSAYTMHVVTLPYSGAARPLPWPDMLDYAARPWLSQIERELIALVDEPRMKGITVLGTAAGGYFAARLGLLRPARVRSVVLVNALVSTSMRSPAHPDAPATFAERQAMLKTVAPTPQLVPVAAVPAADELRRLVADPASTHPTARNWMAFAVKDQAVSRAWTIDALTKGFLVPSLEYRWELTSTDLTDALKELAVPMLVIGSWHDDASPVVNTPNISQWEEMRLRYPRIPLTVVAFDETRSYVSADAPTEFDRALGDFLERRAVQGKAIPASAASRQRATTTIGGTTIEIDAGRPAVKAARIWGGLVPNGRVWSPGSKQATTLMLSAPVTIDGHPLAPGRYTLFAVPGDTAWTVIVNRVPRQWGAFDYNPAFDALRFSVTPAYVPHEETLTWRIQPEGAGAAVVSLAWETRSISFRIENASRVRF